MMSSKRKDLKIESFGFSDDDSNDDNQNN